jgi:hypothetical protein
MGINLFSAPSFEICPGKPIVGANFVMPTFSDFSSSIPESALLEQWNNVKFSLQNPANWSTSYGDDVHLTCLPTLFGFSGQDQLINGFSTLTNFPSSSLFTRFNNKNRTINCAIQMGQNGIVKILDLIHFTIFHNEEFPWLLPRVPASQTELSFAVVISAICTLNEGALKLKEVILNWDQGSLLVQSGLLLEGLKQIAKKNLSPEDFIESFKVDSNKIKSRLECPNQNNITRSAALIRNKNERDDSFAKRNPLNQKTELTMEDPSCSERSPIRKHPAMSGDCFSSPDQPLASDRPAKLHPAISSKVNLGTNFTPVHVAHQIRPQAPTKSVFFSDSPLPPPKPSIALDPKRLASSFVPPEQDKPLIPHVPSLDENRFKSTWSESDDLSEGSPMPLRTSTKILNPKRFESHIFSPAPEPEQKPNANFIPNNNSNLLGGGQCQSEAKFNVKMDPNRFRSSVQFDMAEHEQPAVKQASIENYNGIQMGTFDSPSVLAQQREHSKQAINSRVYSSQKSSAFDFNDPHLSFPDQKPSTR